MPKSHPLPLSTPTPSTVLSSGSSGLVLSSGRRCPAGDLYLSRSISGALEALNGQINLTIDKFRGQVSPSQDPLLRSDPRGLESNLTSTDNCKTSVFKQMNVYKYLLTKITEQIRNRQVTAFFQAIRDFQIAVREACLSGISDCSSTSHAQVTSSSVSGENNSNVLPFPTIESAQDHVHEDTALTEACNSLNAEEDVSAHVGETPFTTNDYAKQGAFQLALRLQKRLRSLPTCDRKRKRSNKKRNDGKGGEGENNNNNDKTGDRKNKNKKGKAEESQNKRRQTKNTENKMAASGTQELVNGASTADPISFTAEGPAQKTKKVGKAPKTTQPSEKAGADGLSEGVLQMTTRKPRKAGEGRKSSNKKQKNSKANSVDKKQPSKKSKRERQSKEPSKPAAS